MKRLGLFVLIILFAAVTGISANENGLNLRLVPERLLRAKTPAIMSSVDLGELPASLDIGSALLIPRSQGPIGSCSSWAVAYEITRGERLRHGWPVGLNRTFFSPSFLYNQVNGGRDRGSSLPSNLRIAVARGCALYITFPYTLDYRKQPPPSAHREAARFRSAEYRVIPVEVDAVRLALARGFGVIVAFRVHENFDQYRGGIYRPSGPAGVLRGNERFLYHAMLIIAFNDTNRIFRLINSWGTQWGDGGFMYISYNDLTALVREAYILVPRDVLPNVAMPPVRVQASKGSFRNHVLISWENNGSRNIKYEIFRLTDNEHYISLGTTTNNFFEDRTVSPNQRYFYFVAAHRGDYMSELSFAAEGWANPGAVEPPGIPSQFTVTRQGRNIIASWRAVDNANLYRVYRFDDTIREFVLAGETSNTTLRIPLPGNTTSPDITFFVLAQNNHGQSLPSEIATLSIDNWRMPDESEITENNNRFEIFRGDFYSFPIQRFAALERQAMEAFRIRGELFTERSTARRNQAEINFRNRQDEFFSRIQGGR